MARTKESRLIKQVSSKMEPIKATPVGTGLILPNHSGDHSRGRVRVTPTTDYEIATKKYVDDNTGDTTLADGKIWIGNASSAPIEYALSGDATMSNAGVVAIGSGVIVNADINASAAIDMSKTALVAGTNCTLSTNTLNVDDAFLKNDASDTGVGLTLTGDNSSADTQYTAQVLYNTDATPPTASNFPIGTIYIQYTA